MHDQPPQGPGAVVTSSWDDGHRFDRKLADLLDEHGVRATFYVAPDNRELPAAARLTVDDVQALAARFEIGSHSLTHADLPRLTPAQCRRELHSSRARLSDCTGREVTSFCYPRGRANRATAALVREAGFGYARTTREGACRLPDDLWLAPTTIEAASTGKRRWAAGTARRGAAGAGVRHCWTWQAAARALFDRTVARGGVFHLWGHSWVFEERGEWDDIAALLAYIGGRDGVRYVTNGQLTAVAG